MNKLTRPRLVLGLALMLGIVASGLILRFLTPSDWRSPPLVPSRAPASGPPVLQLERIGELALVRIHIADVLEAEGEGYRGSWLIKGDAMLTCDVTRAKSVAVDEEKRTAILQLPPIRVRSARVDFEKTKTWSVEKTSWLPWAAGDQSQFRDAAMFHAQQLVEAGANSQESHEAARTQMELILRNLYRATGWDVAVEWIDVP